MKLFKILMILSSVLVISGCGLFSKAEQTDSSNQTTVSDVYQDEYDYFVEYIYVFVERIDEQRKGTSQSTDELITIKEDINNLHSSVEELNTYDSERLSQLQTLMDNIYIGLNDWIDLVINYSEGQIEEEDYNNQTDELLDDIIYNDEELIILQKTLGVYNEE